MKAYILQHGAAEKAGDNPERPLSETGKKDIGSVAGFLAIHGPEIKKVLHSDRLRSRQSAEIIAGALSGSSTEETAGLAPDDNPKGLALKLGMEPDDLAIVGHQPFVGKLVSFLITDSLHASVTDFEPGAIVCLQRDVQGLWAIVWMLRPGLVAD